MTTIVPKKSTKGMRYYKYGYEINPSTGKYKRKYLGTATEQEYIDHKKNLGKFCKNCGKRKKMYADQSQRYCKCQQKQSAGNVAK